MNVVNTLLTFPIIVFTLGACSGVKRVQDEPSPLSGRWEGELVTVQAGGCSIDGKEQTVRRVRLMLFVKADGSLRGQVEQSETEKGDRFLSDDLPPLQGKVDAEQEVVLEGYRKAVCSYPGFERKRTYRIRYEGRFIRAVSGWELQLSGTDEPCPPSKCVFVHHYKVRK